MKTRIALATGVAMVVLAAPSAKATGLRSRPLLVLPAHPTKGYDVLRITYTNSTGGLFWNSPDAPTKVRPNRPFSKLQSIPFTPNDLFILYKWQNHPTYVWHKIRITSKGGPMSFRIWSFKPIRGPGNVVDIQQDDQVCSSQPGPEFFCQRTELNPGNPPTACITGTAAECRDGVVCDFNPTVNLSDTLHCGTSGPAGDSPAASEWGLLAMSASLGVAAVILIRRRGRTSPG